MIPDELTATEYLNQLLQDKTTVSKMPKIFLHSERLLDEGKQIKQLWFLIFLNL